MTTALKRNEKFPTRKYIKALIRQNRDTGRHAVIRADVLKLSTSKIFLIHKMMFKCRKLGFGISVIQLPYGYFNLWEDRKKWVNLPPRPI